MKKAHNYYVYIVECSDKSYYTGVTNDYERRLWEHNNGENKKAYTYKRRPVILKYCEHFYNIKNAIAWEKQLKGWSRKKKEALFVGNWKEIIRLAKSKNVVNDDGSSSSDNLSYPASPSSTSSD
ncbi:GIY-YIG nuclease family protein [Ferruginibacter sp. SUN002]|uniref:GIY-YIG nuclease family protein n=1 Tax=Ferruginibacter sp. SUN002 TaxID=2937789 RepID=UPI003D364896